MVSYNLTGILYSKKNYSLEFKLKNICKQRNIFLTTSTDFIELTIKNSELKPQFIFFDCSTIELLDYKIDAITERPDFKNTNIFFIADECAKVSKSSAITDNITNIVSEDIEKNIDKVLHTIDFAKSISSTYAMNNIELNTDIYKLLTSLGFSTKYVGYSYLCDCIRNVILNNGIIRSLSTEQYVYVATKFRTNVVNVERDIRNIISETWKSFGETWYNVLLAKTLEIGLKPTNREFINMCCHFITLKAKYQIKTIQ